jgi:hypothetical protein
LYHQANSIFGNKWLEAMVVETPLPDIRTFYNNFPWLRRHTMLRDFKGKVIIDARFIHNKRECQHMTHDAFHLFPNAKHVQMEMHPTMKVTRDVTNGLFYDFRHAKKITLIGAKRNMLSKKIVNTTLTKGVQNGLVIEVYFSKRAPAKEICKCLINVNKARKEQSLHFHVHYPPSHLDISGISGISKDS